MPNPFGDELPNEIFKITDDVDAQAFLIKFGIIDKLPNKATLASDGREHINTVACMFKGHPTHWIYAARFHGSDTPTENGFVVMGWPKTKFTIEEFVSIVQRNGPADDSENFGAENPN